MRFEFSEEQEMFRKSVRDFARTEIAPVVAKAEREETFPVHLFRQMGQLGYLCVNYPVEHGAAGLGTIEQSIELEEVSKVSHGICSSIMSHCGIATSMLRDHGSQAQIDRYLKPAIQGMKIGSFGLSEANAGSDVSAIETTARKKDKEYVLNGSKMYITNGAICDFSLVAAYTDRSKRHRGISVFLVDKGAPGLARNKLRKFCVRSSDTAEFVLADCRIPEDNLIGEEGRGFQYLMETLDEGRILHAACRLGAAEAAMDMSLEYAKQRVQFGRPIASNQAIAFKLARMAVEIEAAKWLLYRTAWLYDAKRPCAKEASMSKLLTSEVYQRVAIEAVQIHGGAAALEESEANRHYRDSFLGKVTEGTSEIQELVIARQLGIPGLQ